jgi:predicted transcriptional regulator
MNGSDILQDIHLICLTEMLTNLSGKISYRSILLRKVPRHKKGGNKQMNRMRKNEKRGWYYSYNIIFDLDLSHQAKLIYVFLCRFADSESQSFPSYSTIAEKCNISVTSVKKAIKELVEARLLVKRKRYREDGSQTSNLYEIFSEPFNESEEVIDNEETLEPDNNKSQDTHNQGGAKYAPHPVKMRPP